MDLHRPTVNVLFAASLSSVLACGPQQPAQPNPGSQARANAAKADAAAHGETPARAPERAPVAEPDPAPELALSLSLSRKPDEREHPFELSADPAPQADPLVGLRSWDCRSTDSVPPPCGWAKLCSELGLRWADQIGASTAREQLANFAYQEDCGDGGDAPHPSSSGDFVEHAAVIRHATDALADDGVAGLLVQTQAGWKGLARIRERAIEGMSVQRVHEPEASWQLELDGHPGNELLMLITGYQTGDDELEPFARLVVCHVSPEPACRRIELSSASKLEVFANGTFVVDGREPKSFAQLGRADQLLLKR